MIPFIEQAGEAQSVAGLCAALGMPRSSLYRHRKGEVPAVSPQPRAAPPRSLSQTEKDQVRDLLNSPRFEDKAPREVYATLLDEGKYLCSWRTMYRVLAAHGEIRERRNQLRHPVYSKPELMATKANQVWSWDITKLRGPGKGIYYYLYVILDIYSRYVVGWMIAKRQTAVLAEQLIAETCTNQGIEPGQLTIHADNGSPMVANPIVILLADLGVTKSHSRPHTSDDNPYSEAQFKTLKYHPGYPKQFGCLSDARGWCRAFFDWYNNDHHHMGLGLLIPADVHHGRTAQVLARRQATLQKAYASHPERFVQGPPLPLKPPDAVWINPPKEGDQASSSCVESSASAELNCPL